MIKETHSNAADDYSLALYTAEQCRELDRIAIEQFGIAGIVLMKRAGQAAFRHLLTRWPKTQHISVFCGGGNNGGDGYIVAALAAQQQIATQIISVSDPKNLKGDAALARDFAIQAGVTMSACSANTEIPEGIIVDALLGTGNSGEMRGDYKQAIDAINESNNPVLALDLPSGLLADTGSHLGTAVKADTTITFIGKKRGLFTGVGPVYSGEIVWNDLGVPKQVYEQVASNCSLTQPFAIPKRPLDSHKGKFGHVLVVGGDKGLGGAVLLASEAAARCGAGLVSVATQAEHIGPLLSRRPELMVRGVQTKVELQSLIERASVIVVGPGLGQSSWSQLMLEQVLLSTLPKVIDADALNLLSSLPAYQSLTSDKWVLTPHPGEAARLMAWSNQEIQNNRFAAAEAIQNKRGGVVVLKGLGSLIASSNHTSICTAGNPGMATGGMGDVLSGVIGALLAQGFDLKTAAELGVQVHASAADKASQRGQRGMLASDLFPHLRTLLNEK